MSFLFADTLMMSFLKKSMPAATIQLRESSMASGKHPGEGEIVFKGRNVFMGYLNLEDKTNDTVSFYQYRNFIQ